MSFDFQSVLNKAKVANEEAQSGGNREGGFIEPCIGETKVRLLYNPASQSVVRKVSRHWDIIDNKYVPCLKMYGEKCPLCDVAQEAEKVGKGSWQLNPQTKGIAYVQVYNMTKFPEKGPKKDDITLFRFPKLVYDGINNAILTVGDKIGELITAPEAMVVGVSRTGTGTDTKYNVVISPFEKQKTADTQDKMDEILNGLPNLDEADGCPAKADDNLRKHIQASADARRRELGLIQDAEVVTDGIPKP